MSAREARRTISACLRTSSQCVRTGWGPGHGELDAVGGCGHAERIARRGAEVEGVGDAGLGERTMSVVRRLVQTLKRELRRRLTHFEELVSILRDSPLTEPPKTALAAPAKIATTMIAQASKPHSPDGMAI